MHEEEYGEGLQEAAFAGHAPLLGPAALEDPVGEEQRPHNIGETDGGDHASAQEGEEHQIDAAMDNGSQHTVSFFLSAN